METVILDEYKKKLADANAICARTYGVGTPEFMRANKEAIAQVLEISELKDINKLILEELKKITKALSKDEEVVEEEEIKEDEPKEEVKKVGRPSKPKE